MCLCVSPINYILSNVTVNLPSAQKPHLPRLQLETQQITQWFPKWGLCLLRGTKDCLYFKHTKRNQVQNEPSMLRCALHYTDFKLVLSHIAIFLLMFMDKTSHLNGVFFFFFFIAGVFMGCLDLRGRQQLWTLGMAG